MGYRRESLPRAIADRLDVAIETARLELVPVSREHGPALRALWPRTDDPSEVDALLDECAHRRRMHWLLRSRHNGQIIGLCGFNAWFVSEDRRADEPGDWGELSYYLHPDHRGRGLMAEALAAVVACGFQVLKMSTIAALVAPRNQRSLALLEGAGFSLFGPDAAPGVDADAELLLYVLHAAAAE